MKRPSNSIIITGIIVLSVIILALIISSVFLRVSSSETINVQGISSIFVHPDLIEINFNVETRGATATEARDKNTLVMNNLVNALVNEDFESEEIETRNFNVYEDFDWVNGRQISRGYKVSHDVVLELSEEQTELIGRVIDIGIDNGALLSYINFKLSTELENEYKAIALNLATEDARTKAEAIASGLDVKLGRILSVDSNEFGYSPWIAYAQENKDTVVRGEEIATNIEVGEKEVSGRVSVTYKIK